jgi:hypothetical protein
LPTNVDIDSRTYTNNDAERYVLDHRIAWGIGDALVSRKNRVAPNMMRRYIP